MHQKRLENVIKWKRNSLINGGKIMNDVTRYLKGSEWRKWDLHTHTPLDHEWINKPSLNTEEEKETFAREYIQFAIEQNLSVIGITDHNFCDNVTDLLIPYIKKVAFENDITILPGFEITAKDGSGVHLLVIFSENTGLNSIKSICDRCFKPGEKLVNNSFGVPVSELSIEEIDELLFKSELDYVLIYAHADRDNGVLNSSTIQSQRRMQVWENQIVKIAQLSKPTHEFTNGFIYNVINCNSAHYNREDMVYITASDCRSISEDEEQEGRFHLGEKSVWIKANPTFEGLKQIIHEPDRVKIQEQNPKIEFKKPYFSKIEILGEKLIFKEKDVQYNENKLELNRNLVAIIGGRGTGKSILLDSIARTFNKVRKGYREDRINTDLNFKVTYTKEDESAIEYCLKDGNHLDYLHVHQSNVKEIVESPSNLHKEITKMLNIRNYSNNNEEDEQTKKINNELHEIKAWLKHMNEDRELVNTIEYNNIQKKKYEELIETITTKNNRQLIEEYGENSKTLENANKKLEELQTLKQGIVEYTEYINRDIVKVNEALKENFKVTLVSTKLQMDQLKTVIDVAEAKLQGIKDKNEEIKRKFKADGIEGDIATLLEKVDDYHKMIQIYDEKIESIEKATIRLAKLNYDRIELVVHLERKLIKEINEINEKWEGLQGGKDGWTEEQVLLLNQLLADINIYGEVKFDIDKFYEYVGGCLNGNKFRPSNGITRLEKIKQFFNIYSYDDFIKLIKNEGIIKIDERNVNLEEVLEEDIFIKDGERDLLAVLFNQSIRNEYLAVISKVKYKGKEPHELSVGQRGTLFICLQLATNPFSTPLIFDQPEDDLDNNFIMEELVPIFKKIKEYRQIIIVTHNANVVVNADAEQVLVAYNENEIISYKSGALEDPEIRGEVCKILEGGERAFAQREKKYGIKKKVVLKMGY